ncbi:hypothetical protein [Neisseria meningitidis]|uniref:hypothetical protein n=1 Tax=Neisseria meningitidis TaxID=487 RepID=UPI000AEAB213|nr:hypothetical protein [Neisseria meningitidis]MCL4976252.1 hypothetical protein [Neisseria meningitidis]MCL4982976.1 hypothetical protein [Neisseria meningitidis]MCL5002947.1 hypothetical protein [Neisseria meningitidis]MCL5705141.1 hypothetical protein [Neisseria meningitidis]MCL5711107.1 hypothetical protein [Neisseria meningitidis]
MPRGRGCFGFHARLRRALLSGYAVCTAAVSAWFDAVGHLCGYALIFGSAVLPVSSGIFSSASIVNLLILPFAKSSTQWLRCPCF